MADIAFFDFDGTITNADTFTKFVYFATDPTILKKGKFLLAPYIIGYKLKLVSGSTIRSKVFKLGFKGRLEQEIKKIGNEYSLNFIPTVLRTSTMERIQWHKNQKHKIVVVSASIDLYLKPWCDQHNLDLICSEAEILNGVLTGNYVNKDCSGLIKKNRILKNYNLANYNEIYVYGDTVEDMEMLFLGTQKIYRWKPYLR